MGEKGLRVTAQLNYKVAEMPQHVAMNGIEGFGCFAWNISGSRHRLMSSFGVRVKSGQLPNSICPILSQIVKRERRVS